jgi:hypothetical protein
VGTPASAESSLPARRDWIDLTARLATSWVGLFTAYVVALLLAFTKFNELKKGLHELGISPWGGVAMVAAFPLLALIFSTVPAFLDQRRIKRYAEITGTIQTGYFTLRPRENEEGFERADNAHQEILRWIENNREPVLYLTGASGTGKSSLLSAWVLPKLEREGHVVIRLRGYEDDLLTRIKDGLLRPGLIWDKEPVKTDDLGSLLDRATRRLGQRRLFIVVDQFEEFLILRDEEGQKAFQQFLSAGPTDGVTFLLVYRPEYEGLIQDQPWPRMQLDTNRRVLSPFTENAAQEFMRKSGLTVNPDLMRRTLREAAEIEQTSGLIRPVSLNLCGLVLSRFSSGLPRRFRGGLIRGFLRESLSLPEVRDVAEKLIPALVTDNVTKRPRRIEDLVQVTQVPRSAVRACLRRLGESDRAIVRPVDREQETWEISHDFLVPLLDSIVARRTVSSWRRFRPWLPWGATAIMGIALVAIPLMTREDPTVTLRKQGWRVSEDEGVLVVERNGPVPPDSVSTLRGRPFKLVLSSGTVTDLSILRELKGMTSLDLSYTEVADVTALKDLKSVTTLNLRATKVADVTALKELKSLTSLDLSYTEVADVKDLKSLTSLDLRATKVADVTALKELKSLTYLYLRGTKVTDVTALKEIKNLRIIP